MRKAHIAQFLELLVSAVLPRFGIPCLVVARRRQPWSTDRITTNGPWQHTVNLSRAPSNAEQQFGPLILVSEGVYCGSTASSSEHWIGHLPRAMTKGNPVFELRWGLRHDSASACEVSAWIAPCGDLVVPAVSLAGKIPSKSGILNSLGSNHGNHESVLKGHGSD